MIRPPPRSTLFPSPTLFRSRGRRLETLELPPHPALAVGVGEMRHQRDLAHARAIAQAPEHAAKILRREAEPVHSGVQLRGGGRSEEHTSELQSHSDLVCRLL